MTMTLVCDDILRCYPDSITVRVVGESMRPTLDDDDRLLLDVSATNPINGEVVGVFVRNSGHIVGRFRKTRNGAWLAKDNRAFASVFLGDASRFVVTGTVRWVVQRSAKPGVVGIPINVLNPERAVCALSDLPRRVAAAAKRFRDSYHHLLAADSQSREAQL